MNEVIVEEWKPIEGFKDYLVSNYGRVKSIEKEIVNALGHVCKRKERILSQAKDGKGYKEVWLFNFEEGARRKTGLKVHRLVAQAFIPNPENKSQIDHIDTNKENNCVSNLRWVTGSENCLNRLTVEKNSRHTTRGRNPHARPIYQLSMKGEIIKRFDCINDAVESLGLSSHAHICDVCRGIRKQCAGYMWRYADL